MVERGSMSTAEEGDGCLPGQLLTDTHLEETLSSLRLRLLGAGAVH